MAQKEPIMLRCFQIMWPAFLLLSSTCRGVCRISFPLFPISCSLNYRTSLSDIITLCCCGLSARLHRMVLNSEITLVMRVLCLSGWRGAELEFDSCQVKTFETASHSPSEAHFVLEPGRSVKMRGVLVKLRIFPVLLWVPPL